MNAVLTADAAGTPRQRRSGRAARSGQADRLRTPQLGADTRAARVLPRARPFQLRPSDHTRTGNAGAWEQQADRAALRAIRGDLDPLQGLGRAPAAGPLAPASAGQPIAGDLLADLEDILLADLAAVRIHTDAAAADLASRYGAAALTAAHHVYFGRDRYDPATPAGMYLLVHELSHVLQQTATRSRDGRLRAQATTGSGEPQARKSPLDDSGVEPVPDLAEILRRHRAAAKGDRLVKDQITAVEDKLADPGALAQHWVDIENRVLDQSADDSPERVPLNALLYDLLKRAERWAGVRQQLLLYPNLPTCYYDPRVYETIPDPPAAGSTTTAPSTSTTDPATHGLQPETWSNQLYFAWFGEPALKKFGPDRWVNALFEFLLLPTRAVPNLDATGGTFPEPVDGLLDRRKVPTGLIPNEVALVAAAALKQADVLRIRKLSQFAAEAAAVPIGQRELTKRGLVALKVIGWLTDLEAGKGGLESALPEVRELYAGLIPAMRIHAEAARNFWETVSAVESARAAGMVILGIDPVTLLRDFGRRNETRKFMTAIAPAVKTLLALEEDPATGAADPTTPATRNTLPSADVYQKNLRTLVAAVKRASHESFERTFMAELRKAVSAPRKDQGAGPRIEALLFALGWIEAHVDLFVDRYGELNTPTTDDLIHHRLEVARWLGRLADAFGIDEILLYAQTVTSASLAGQTTTMLALLSDWDKTPGSLTRLTQDFAPDTPIGGFGSVTARDLQNFYQTLYFTDFADQIDAALQAEQVALAAGAPYKPVEQKPGEATPTIVSEAERAIDTSRLPTRHAVAEVDWAISPQEARDWGLIIESHPKTQAAFASQLGSDLLRIYPTNPPGVFVWFLPPQAELVARLREIRALNRLLAEREWGEPIPDVALASHPAYRHIEALAWHDWWIVLREAYVELGADAFKPGAALASKALAKESEAARARLTDAMHRASVHERTQRVAKHLAPTLAKYARFGQLDKADTPLGTMLVYEIPDVVATHLDGLIGALSPIEEQPAHLTAAVLELAELFDDKLTDEPRADVIVVFKVLATQAVDHVSKDRPAVLAVLAGTEQDDAWIDARVKRLQHAIGKWEAAEAERQVQFGIEAMREGDAQLITGVGEPHAFKPNDSFTIDGVKWTIVRVEQSFVFHPKHGTAPSRLLLGGVEVTGEARAKARLVTVKFNDGPERTITGRAHDESLLADLSHAITMAAIVAQLESLAELIETVSMLALEGAEFIPGAGQVVMATRLAIAILEFITSPEFDNIVHDVFVDPKGAFDRVIKLLDLFDPLSLWTFLLFGNQRFDQLRAAKKDPKPPVRRTGRGAGAALAQLARVVGRLAGIGLGLFGAAARLQTQIRWRAEHLQLFVLGHPFLARVLRIVADNIERIVGVVEKGIDLVQNWADIVQGMTQKFVDTVEAFARFEVPKVIVPMGDIVEIIVDLVISRMGKKIKAAAWVIFQLLDLAGKKQAVFDAIGGAIPKNFDLNTIWQSQIREPIQKKLGEARDEFLNSLLDTMAEFEFFAPVVDKLREGKSKANVGGGPVSVADAPAEAYDVPTAAPALRPGATVRPEMAVTLPTGPGRPLATAWRRPAERLLGSDLGHVRVHRGAGTTATLDRLGAHALTAGSHIYLPATTPSGPAGRRLVHHELAHVVQQTGRRSPTGPAPRPPVGPVPGSSTRLHVDARQEAAADATAHGTPSPLRATGYAAQGKFPDELIRRILDRVTGVQDVEHDAERAARSAAQKEIPKDIRARVEGYPANLLTELRGRKLDISRKPWKDGATEIRRHFDNQEESNHAAIKNGWDDVVRDAMELSRKPAKGAAGSKGGVKEAVWVLDVERLGDAVARLVFAETGILLNVQFESKGDTAPVTVKSLVVLYVHLPDVHGNSNIWKRAVEGLGLGTGAEAIVKRLKIADYLRAKGPSSDVWKSDKFQLESDIYARAEKWVLEKRTAGGDLTPDQLPSRADYLDLDKKTGQTVGLRLGVYRDKSQQDVPDRDSHHITQYLLLEYFANKKKTRPFHLLSSKNRDVYPDLKAKSDGTVGKVGETYSRLMNVAGLEDVHGAQMPTILLARATHQFGRLHVGQDIDDRPGSVSAPGDIVHDKFRTALGKEFDDSTVEKLQAYKDLKGNKYVADRIYSAMQGTYNWMRARMLGRLGPALKGIELHYYDSRAPLSPHKNDRLSEADLDVVYAKAALHNDRELAKWGWKVKG